MRYAAVSMEDRYVELLGDTDLELLGRASGHRPLPDAADWFRASPSRIVGALDDPTTFEALFGPESAEPLATVSPLLIFALVVHRGADEIGDVRHVPERLGNRLLVPVFDGDRLARFTAEPESRAFLVELLGSYTRVMSGPRWERTRGRWRRRRFSEMNPAQLALVAAELPYQDRAGAYRRLGDLALFLNGIFPDASARRSLTPIELERVLRSVPVERRGEVGHRLLADRIDGTGPVLAALGPQWYRLAAELVPIPSMSEQLRSVADQFDQARRFLTFVADRYLWPHRDGLFPLGRGID